MIKITQILLLYLSFILMEIIINSEAALEIKLE